MKTALNRWTRVLAVGLCSLVRLQAQTGAAATVTGTIVSSTKSNAPAPGDILTLLPARSISLTMTFGYAPAR